MNLMNAENKNRLSPGTNILIYAMDKDGGSRHEISREIVE